ncbi:hypothetical protein HYT54_01255 [Candidatus Woesearchaeota archaeon]|nr:hypothetical protein [Candidatus Woesearchaeota archaeon]
MFNVSSRLSGILLPDKATFSIPACGVSGTFSNSSVFFPFNTSGTTCTGKNLTVSVLITVNDTAGNSNSSTYLFGVDDIPPGIVLHNPSSNNRVFADNMTLNWSVREEFLGVQFVGYYIDGKGVDGSNTPFQLNFSASGLGNGTGNGNHTYSTKLLNISVSNNTLGTHTIKLFANDTVGNQFNTSAVTFIGKGTLDFALINNSLISSVDNASINLTIRVKVGDSYAAISGTDYANSTIELAFVANSSERTINISISDLNGSNVNWDKINFSLIASMNGTAPPISTVSYNLILGNWSVNAPLAYVFSNISTNFIADNNSYYSYIIVPYNISGADRTAQEIWWFANSRDVSSRTNVSQCTSVFTKTTTTPCWNFTSGGQTIIFVPHFSDVLVVNDTTAPKINVTTPGVTDGNQTISAFIPNITVSGDTTTCKYNLTNGSQNVNVTMSIDTTVTPHRCVGQTEKLKNNLVNGPGGAYNITFYATDAAGNVNTYLWAFNMSDNTPPNSGQSVTSSPSTTTATITINSVNETVNATINYGTTNTSLGSSATQWHY